MLSNMENRSSPPAGGLAGAPAAGVPVAAIAVYPYPDIEYSGAAQRGTRPGGSNPLPGMVWRQGCGGRRAGLAALSGLLISVPMVAAGVWGIHRHAEARDAARAAIHERYRAHDRLIASEPDAVLPVDVAQRGRRHFVATCAACHKADGTGVEGLGRDLTTSWFVALSSDEELVRFIESGRPAESPLNLAKVAMPARGGNDALTSEDLAAVVTYLRGLQDSRRMPPLPAEAPALAYVPPSESDTAKWLAAAKGDAELAEYIASGSKLFAMTCSACHGKDARGLRGNGKDLVASELCRSLDDEALLAFVQRGRDPSDPANTTGVGMPAKGGNPALSEDDLLDIIAYLRALQAGVE